MKLTFNEISDLKNLGLKSVVLTLDSKRELPDVVAMTVNHLSAFAPIGLVEIILSERTKIEIERTFERLALLLRHFKHGSECDCTLALIDAKYYGKQRAGNERSFGIISIRKK